MFVGAHLLEAPTTNLAQGVRGETSDLLASRTLSQIPTIILSVSPNESVMQ